MSSSESESDSEAGPAGARPLTHVPPTHLQALHVASSSRGSGGEAAASVGGRAAFSAVASQAPAHLHPLENGGREIIRSYSASHHGGGSMSPQHAPSPLITSSSGGSISLTSADLAAAGGAAAERATGSMGSGGSDAGGRRRSSPAAGSAGPAGSVQVPHVVGEGDAATGVQEDVQGSGSPAVLLPQGHVGGSGDGSYGWEDEQQQQQQQQQQRQGWLESLQQHEGEAGAQATGTSVRHGRSGSDSGDGSQRRAVRGRRLSFEFDVPFEDRGEGEASTSYDAEGVQAVAAAHCMSRTGPACCAIC